MASDYIDQFRDLTVDKAHGPESVHKPCMLLAVIDLVERGALTENKIRYEDTLSGFKTYANAVRPGKDMKPYLPFYHLNGEEFWSLRPKRGTNYKGIRPSHRRMAGTCALLAADLHRLLLSSRLARHELRDVLIDRWFPRERSKVEAIINLQRPR